MSRSVPQADQIVQAAHGPGGRLEAPCSAGHDGQTAYPQHAVLK